jgi:hypothetical protein
MLDHNYLHVYKAMDGNNKATKDGHNKATNLKPV